MNHERRCALKAIRADIKGIMNRLSEVKDVEEDILGRMSEKEQFSSKGEAYEERINTMLNALEYLKDAMHEVEEAYA